VRNSRKDLPIGDIEKRGSPPEAERRAQKGGAILESMVLVKQAGRKEVEKG